jgi:hypothetical protein
MSRVIRPSYSSQPPLARRIFTKSVYRIGFTVSVYPYLDTLATLG